MVADTTGHFLANPSAIFTRVPPPNLIGTIMADQEAVSSLGSSNQPNPATVRAHFGQFTVAAATNQSKLSAREFELDKRPHIADKPLNLFFVRFIPALADETNPWQVRGNATSRRRGTEAIGDDMNLRLIAQVPPVVLTADRHNIKTLCEEPLAPSPDPGHSPVE